VIFINLAGAVALLLWAARMVRTGIERAYGDFMRQQLRHALGNRVNAAAAGFFLAIALQSATAVALIVSGFVASGYVSSAIGIATLLGADLGSAFVVRLLRHDLSLLVPLLLIFGTIAFRATESRRWREMGRILFGLGLLLLSLRLISEASLPLKDSPILPVIISYLAKDWITAFLLAGLIAWGFHSSVATILLFASLTDQGLIPAVLIIPLVLGANFGAAVMGGVLTRGEANAARIVPLGNIAIRGVGMVIGLILQLFIKLRPELYFSHLGNAIVWVHVIANAVAVLLGLPLVMTIARLLSRALPTRPAQDTQGFDRFSALNPSDLGKPQRALDNATREVVGMCDKIALMLDRIFEAFDQPDAEQMKFIETLDDSVDHYHKQIKMYLAKVSETELDQDSALRLQDLLGATIKLEQAADIISQNMLARARKKQARNASFSEEGWKELSALHQRVIRNARLAFNLIVNRDLEHARQLVREKETVRDMVRQSEEMHIKRLSGGNTASIDSSSIHIDTMRDLKEINSLLVSIAYPVLSNAGLLRESRLL
jgi:phosphate:Na+ symporter